jgi:hypothetical protein
MEALKLTSRTPKVRDFIVQNGLVIALALGGSGIFAQSSDSNPQTAYSAATGKTEATSNSDAASSQPWIVRDPGTGRVFQQKLVPVSVPVTRWEPRTIEQTVYEPRLATHVQQVPQTTYVPNTQYVMQPKVTGWWNPFKQPVQAYKYVPVTNWTPQTQQVPNPVTTQQWVPRQQKIVVYQPVQSTEVRQQLVQTELPQPQTTPSPLVYAATPRQPLFRLPILAQQRVLPWPAAAISNGTGYAAPATALANTPTLTSQTGWRAVGQQPLASSVANAAPSITPNSVYSPPAYTLPVSPQIAASGLRAVGAQRSPQVLPPLLLPRFASSPYSAPLQTTTSVGSTASRDILQAGMQPTVLR